MPTSLSDPTILELFRAASQPSRQSFLSALSQQFLPSDWHHLQRLLQVNSYYMDFLHLLPLEISLQILCYLPLEELIILRRVSRRWNTLLRSPEVCRTLTHHFFPATTGLIAYRDPTTRFENLASRHLSFVRGKPTDRYKLSTYNYVGLDNPWDGAYYVDIDFANTRMAWVEGDDRRGIVVHNFLTRTEVLPRVTMDERYSIGELALSESLVAAISSTMGVCQVWDLATGKSHTFKMPGAVVAAVQADGHVVAVLLHRLNLEYQLVVHNAATRRTRCIDITCKEQYDGNQLLVHAASGRVVHVKLRAGGHLDWELTAWALDDGRLLEAVTHHAQHKTEMRQFQPVGGGRWVVEGCLESNGERMLVSRQLLDLTKPGIQVVASRYTVDLTFTEPYRIDWFRSCGAVSWAVATCPYQWVAEVVWGERDRTARLLGFRRFGSEEGELRPFPLYVDPQDRFVLRGRGLQDILEWSCHGRGFENDNYLVEMFKGVHEAEIEASI